jgi:hypothetical protein
LTEASFPDVRGLGETLQMSEYCEEKKDFISRSKSSPKWSE